MCFKKLWLYILFTIILFPGCNRKSYGMMDESGRIRINHFDTALFAWINSDDPASLQKLINDYPQLLGLLGKSIFQANETDSAVFFNRLKNYYSEPTLKSLYKDAIILYDSDSPATKQIEKELSNAFKRLSELFPSMQVPAVFMHVSGLQQNIIVADSLLSFSIDKYMGATYLLYEDFFYDYQRKSMRPERVAIDGLYAWLTTEFPRQSQENTLLDRMIYEGKIIYLLTQVGVGYSFQQILSMDENEYSWCLKNESALWKTLIERNHLNTMEAMTISKYFQSAPSNFISADAPGNLGNFIGYRIVSRYMKQTRLDCKSLIQHNNTQEILQKSKYKP